MTDFEIIPNPDPDQPNLFPGPLQQRYVADHLQNDHRAWLRYDLPMICLEYTGDDFEEVASYLPDPEKNDWILRELHEESFDPIIEGCWYHPSVKFYRDITEGYTPGYRIWVTFQAHGVKTWTDYGYEWDIDWEVDVLWEDHPSWQSQIDYIQELCLEVLEKKP